MIKRNNYIKIFLLFLMFFVLLSIKTCSKAVIDTDGSYTIDKKDIAQKAGISLSEFRDVEWSIDKSHTVPKTFQKNYTAYNVTAKVKYYRQVMTYAGGTYYNKSITFTIPSKVQKQNPTQVTTQPTQTQTTPSIQCQEQFTANVSAGTFSFSVKAVNSNINAWRVDESSGTVKGYIIPASSGTSGTVKLTFGESAAGLRYINLRNGKIVKRITIIIVNDKKNNTGGNNSGSGGNSGTNNTSNTVNNTSTNTPKTTTNTPKDTTPPVISSITINKDESRTILNNTEVEYLITFSEPIKSLTQNAIEIKDITDSNNIVDCGKITKIQKRNYREKMESSCTN